MIYIPITFSQIQILRDQGISEISILDVLRRVAIKYSEIVKKNVPVDTGRLKANMRVEILVDRNGLAITNPTFYGGFVNYGTRKMRPRMFAQRYVPDIISEVLAGLQQLSPTELTRNPIRQFRNDESGLYSGQTTQTLTKDLIGRVVSNLVRPQTVGGLSVSNVQVADQSVQSLQIDNLVVLGS